MSIPRSALRREWFALALLIAIMVAELVLSVRRQSQTWDEACHIYAGYASWKQGDFGINPEHPPLVKLVATLPLLNLRLLAPTPQNRNFKVGAFLDGHDFLYSNDAARILFRTRIAASMFTILLAILVYAAAREMFGTGAAFLALALFVLEPSILAHGALVTTDIGAACFYFATVFAFYRYTRRPSLGRLLITGAAAGLALSVKHSAILLFPILVLLALVDLWISPAVARCYVFPKGRHSLRLAASLAVIAVIAVALLWSTYGFRFSSRPNREPLQPTFSEYVDRLKHPYEARAIRTLANAHVLPESYLYGLVDIRLVEGFSASYLFGNVYPNARWFYFPVAFLIKSSLALLFLLVAGVVLLPKKFREAPRELLFLIIPPASYLAVAIMSGLNLGVRHILPIYPFLIVLAAAAGTALIKRDRRWLYAVVALLVFDAISSVRSFPRYISFSNELWGGSSQTYKLLTDSNVDWGEQLPSIKKYLDQRRVRDCWFAYFADVVADPAYYGIPCKPLPTIASVWLQPWREVPASIDGPVLISAGVLSGYEFGAGELNPYDQFQRLKPATVIDNAVFVYDGHFDVPLAAALNHVTRASLYEQQNNLEAALAEAQRAAALAPTSVWAQQKLGSILRAMNRPEEARIAFKEALTSAQTIQPERQKGWVPGLLEALK